MALPSAVDPEKPIHKKGVPPEGTPEGELAQNPAVDEFFTRLSQDMRRPKPGQEAIAAALQAIHRLALEADSEDALDYLVAKNIGALPNRQCVSCGANNRGENRFCAKCGVSLQPEVPELSASAPDLPISFPEPQPGMMQPEASASSLPPGQHHYHHHYHHHLFADGAGQGMSADARPAGVRDTGRGRTALSGPSLTRAETAVRKLMQDWALACNTKQLADLVDLYTADALVLRPNSPAVRGAAAIREFFFAALDSGLGEAELDPIRVEVFGDIAYEAGRCKTLVPVAVGKRREERGKYLAIYARQSSGDWKIVTDCWSNDLSLGVTAESPAVKPMAQAAPPIQRPPRKTP